MIKQVFVLRHFKTEHNISGKINGRSLNLPVLETFPIICDDQFDNIICSQAVRCKQTIDQYLIYHDTSEVLYTSEILERDMGIFEGQYRSEMKNKYPELFFENKFDVFATPPSGESYEVFYQRVVHFWKKYSCELDGSLLICSHNQFLKMLSFVISGKELTNKEWNSLSFPYGQIVRIF